MLRLSALFPVTPQPVLVLDGFGIERETPSEAEDGIEAETRCEGLERRGAVSSPGPCASIGLLLVARVVDYPIISYPIDASAGLTSLSLQV